MRIGGVAGPSSIIIKEKRWFLQHDVMNGFEDAMWKDLVDLFLQSGIVGGKQDSMPMFRLCGSQLPVPIGYHRMIEIARDDTFPCGEIVDASQDYGNQYGQLDRPGWS